MSTTERHGLIGAGVQRRLAVVWRFARGLVRADEAFLAVVAAFTGVIAGTATAALSIIVQRILEAVFRVHWGERLTAAASVDPWLAFGAPVVGGLVLGLVTDEIVRRRWKRRLPVDPIEANALHGGRMSLTDTALLTLQNIISNGFGASIGLEAGFTQLGSALSSRVGQWLGSRRADMRVLVGCGAGGAIAAAFHAPLTGAFYGFELVIGVYSIANLTPVMVASLFAVLVNIQLVGPAPTLPSMAVAVSPETGAAAAALGAICAMFGIALMTGSTLVERLMRESGLPTFLRPMFGGLVVGALALYSTQVLSSGHGALESIVTSQASLTAIALLLAAKAVASSVSIGAGFRGGLFFAALFLGAMIGKVAAAAGMASLAPGLSSDTFAVIGMAALAAAVVGGPLTMAFLALEMTADFRLSVLALTAVVAASLTVRRAFGYSFATWRLHLRGESIRSAHDVGWIRDLTVGGMMRRDAPSASAGLSLAAFRRLYPLGSTHRVTLVDENKRYVGLLPVPLAHSDSNDPALDEPVAGLAILGGNYLTPKMNAKEAMAAFDDSEAEALAVVESKADPKVVGQLTEAHVLKRYSEESERRRREQTGE
ncbi:MAG: chloride channel protein [Hyphomicrobiales bacterium]|nr:chloride channel protein [Hyphomicrobiales bacterium]